MKGFIDKSENGWFIAYVAVSDGEVGTVIRELPLHPDDVLEMRVMSERFGNLEARIFADPGVDFTIREECSNYGGKHFGRDCGCREGFVQYAKIVKLNVL